MKKRGTKKRQKRRRRSKENRNRISNGGVRRDESIQQATKGYLKRETEKGSFIDSTIGRYVSLGIQFLREARMELKKVKWPTKKELLASTVMVILLVLVVAFFLGLVDFGVIKIIKNIIG